MKLYLCPITLKQANEFVDQYHRHHIATQGHKFSIGVIDDTPTLHGAVIAGRPVARALDDGWTAEVTRLCTDGTPNACSMLYAAAWRAAKAMGYQSLITYTLACEPGTSLRASGFRVDGVTPGRSWNVPSRPRDDNHVLGERVRWIIGADLTRW